MVQQNKLLAKRYALIQTLEPRAYRIQDPTTFTIFLPPSTTLTKTVVDDITEATDSKRSFIGVDVDLSAKSVTFYMPQDYELHTPQDLTNLQPNGELYPGELTNARRKVRNITIDRPPYYRSRPRGGKTVQDKNNFDDEFDRFAQ